MADSLIRERLRNWARVYRDRTKSSGGGGVLAAYTDTWREDRYKSKASTTRIDVRDADTIEKAILKLDWRDISLLRDWYLYDYSIGKISRRNGIFFRAVELQVERAERRLEIVLENDG